MEENIKDTWWFIWSIEHNGWWMPKSCGYARDKKHAGLYKYDEALRIVNNANMYQTSQAGPKEAMIKAN